jgi:hypothetical protein
MKLESSDERLVHDREYNEADVEHLVKKSTSSSTTEKFRWLSQSKATSLVTLLWTDSPFDHSGNRPKDGAVLASVSNVSKNVGDRMEG